MASTRDERRRGGQHAGGAAERVARTSSSNRSKLHPSAETMRASLEARVGEVMAAVAQLESSDADIFRCFTVIDADEDLTPAASSSASSSSESKWGLRRARPVVSVR